MCYSAQVEADFRKYKRQFGADLDLKAFVKTFWWDQGKDPRRVKAPRALFRELLTAGPADLAENIRAGDLAEIADLEREVFAQRKRVNDAERALQAKETKKALEDVRIGTNKGKDALRRLDTLKRTEAKPADSRIFPGMYAPVMVVEHGKRVIKPMRYQCRPDGKPSLYDRKYPGTYNARRDNLEGFWSGQFGHHHAVMVVSTFYEHVEIDGKNEILEFTPRDGSDMLVACLWSHWTDPAGKEPNLLSFAAITDEPEPEVAAAGHDRTIINIKPEHLDAWLNPDPNNLAALYAIFDDKQHPYYEHRLEKAA